MINGNYHSLFVLGKARKSVASQVAQWVKNLPAVQEMWV